MSRLKYQLGDRELDLDLENEVKVVSDFSTTLNRNSPVSTRTTWLSDAPRTSSCVLVVELKGQLTSIFNLLSIRSTRPVPYAGTSFRTESCFVLNKKN